MNNANDIRTLGSRSPNSLAAAAIFLAAELKGLGDFRSAEDIGKTCGAAENTIKQTLKLMNLERALLLPAEYAIASESPTAKNK